MKTKLFKTIQKHYLPEYEHVPDKNLLFYWLEELLVFLFPTEEKTEYVLSLEWNEILNDFKKILLQTHKTEQQIAELTEKFNQNINGILEQLHQDAQETLDNDPAAFCLSEILHTYPGFYAISIYRIAHCLAQDLQLKFIPRMLTEHGHSRTGIDIHPNAQIDSPFFIDHGTGVVIGETCSIGKNVKIYQGVTLGALQVSKDLQGVKRHPTVEDEVVIYANATILGGDTVIGNNSVIGGNVFLTKSVQPYSLVYTKSETVVKPIESNKNEPINFVI